MGTWDHETRPKLNALTESITNESNVMQLSDTVYHVFQSAEFVNEYLCVVLFLATNIDDLQSPMFQFIYTLSIIQCVQPTRETNLANHHKHT